MNSIKDSTELFKLAADLVKIPSYSFLYDSEKAIAEYIYNIFMKEGIESEIIEVIDGRPNVYAVIRGSGKGKSLMLSGHLDTVPAYGMENPFNGEIKDGKLYGRGSCDMKGALAAMIFSMISLKRDGIELKGDLYFTGVIDEEEKGKGIAQLIQSGPCTDGAIIGEPTNLRIAAGNKGLEWMEIVVLGKTVHGGEMDKGINAISKAAKLITRLETTYIPKLVEKRHHFLGAPTLNLGTIIGGDQPSSVPGQCSIRVDRRWVPGETIEEVYQGIETVIRELKQEDSQFNAELKDIFEKDDLMPHQPFFTKEDDPLINATKNAMISMKKEGYILNKDLTVFPAWSDAGCLSNFTNTSCIVLGPGNLALAHTAEEYIEVEEILKAAILYRNVAMEYCGCEN